jgi:hypothetical protein
MVGMVAWVAGAVVGVVEGIVDGMVGAVVGMDVGVVMESLLLLVHPQPVNIAVVRTSVSARVQSFFISLPPKFLVSQLVFPGMALFNMKIFFCRKWGNYGKSVKWCCFFFREIV